MITLTNKDTPIVNLTTRSSAVQKLHIAPTQFDLLRRDLTLSFWNWQFWVHLGWEDVAKQYRRSFLGPVWISINTAIFVFAFGMIGAQLFKMDVETYLPYFCIGHVVFTFLSSLVNEGCQTYMAAEAFLKQTPYPKFAFALRVVWRNCIMFIHNLPVALLVLLWSGRLLQVNFLGLVFALFLTLISASMLTAIVGVVSARYRDVPMIVSSIMQISFFVTPVIWQSSQLTERAQILVNYNPLAAYLELLRAPLLGQAPSNSAYIMVAGVMVVLLVLFATVFMAARRRIVYWI